MLNKDTLIKIAVALLVVAIVWFILKARKKSKRKHRKVIVTAMPTIEKYDDPMEDEEEEVENFEEEGYAEWNAEEDMAEEYDEFSPVEYKSELLE